MSDETNKEVSLRYLPFRGKKEEWTMWSHKFLAKARKKGYKDLLTGKNKALDEEDDDFDEVEFEKFERLNEEAYYDLSTAMEDKIAFNKVALSTSKRFPDGDAYIAWKALNTKYKPRTAQTRAELKLEFATLKHKDWTKDPDEWIDRLEELRAELEIMGSKISEEDTMIHILNNLPSQYETIVEKLISEISILKIEDVREEIQSKYRRLMKYADEDNEKAEQVLVASNTFKKKFKGKCNKCGIYGHKAAECRNVGNETRNRNSGANSSGRFNGKCNYCGKIGHKEAVCRKKLREKGSTESANAATEIEEEMVLMCHEVLEENDIEQEEECLMAVMNEQQELSKFNKNTYSYFLCEGF